MSLQGAHIPGLRADADALTCLLREGSKMSITFRRDLAELNAEFIGLAADGFDLGLAAPVQQRIARFDAAERRALAAVPFALFGLGFEEEGAWTTLLSSCVRDLEPGYVAARAPAEQFALLVLSTLRTCVRMASRSTSSWIGLPPGTRRRLAVLEIGLLPPAAACAAPRLRARRVLHETTWTRLVDAVADGDERQLVILAALGRQWSIRRSLGIKAATVGAHAFRR